MYPSIPICGLGMTPCLPGMVMRRQMEMRFLAQSRFHRFPVASLLLASPRPQSGCSLAGPGPCFSACTSLGRKAGVRGFLVAAFWLTRESERGARRRRLPFLSLRPTWAWWISRDIPKVWEKRLLLRSPRSLQPPEALSSV